MYCMFMRVCWLVNIEMCVALGCSWLFPVGEWQVGEGERSVSGDHSGASEVRSEATASQ